VTAEIVLPCADLNATLAFFEELGFRVDAISPADDPATAVVSGHGLRIRFARGASGDPGLIRLCGREAAPLVAPNGTRIERVAADPPIAMPPLDASLAIVRADGDWHVGRAGMRYRDLVPGRYGGRYIASHIQIPDGGPVPDYVHFHKIRFQLIYCYRGWVRVVYEDAGPPFVLEPGDCVLQPPEIRHRVLESSPGLEVIEISCPASHDTFADHALALPTRDIRERTYGGQRFVRHVARDAVWVDHVRDLGIAAATAGLATARVIRRAARRDAVHDGEIAVMFVLAGDVGFTHAGGTLRLARADTVAVPASLPYSLVDPSDDLELLEVAVGKL
jgi:mannose-6-phosphate isomerase-like protein (cupin superfamily)